MKRRVIQLIPLSINFDAISQDNPNHKNRSPFSEVLFALCDDGTIWQYRPLERLEERWWRLPPLEYPSEK